MRIEFMDASQERRRVIRIEGPAYPESVEWLTVIFAEMLLATDMGGRYLRQRVSATAGIGGDPDDEDAGDKDTDDGDADDEDASGG
ncbi:MAG: hypothetical protein WC145_05870 [Aliarcobacter sp.]